MNMRIAILSLLSLLALSSVACAGGKERDLGSFGVWRAYAYDEGGQTVCYMVTTKTVKTSGPQKRTAPYLMITHRPVEASTDVVSYGAGAMLDSKHGVRADVGAAEFDLFSVRDTAWSRDALTDHKLVKALKAASSLRVSGIADQKGAKTITDVFDLTGAVSAYRAIGQACGLPDLDAPKPVIKKKGATKASAVKVESKTAPSKQGAAKAVPKQEGTQKKAVKGAPSAKVKSSKAISKKAVPAKTMPKKATAKPAATKKTSPHPAKTAN